MHTNAFILVQRSVNVATFIDDKQCGSALFIKFWRFPSEKGIERKMISSIR